ncbi:MAG: S1 RNA-binding domain-containing protein [Lachnospiraceae bacterium]|nr:S1 RNA-binding domain-containing protein [Lachnospiraceae bacterium]
MLKLGEKQTLEIMKKVEFGVYLKHPEDAEGEERVLLPAKQVPTGAGVGDSVEVFLYKDSKDRLIATTKTPLLMMDEVKVLKVAQVGKMGAFLDWGLEKDLFLPFREQTRKVREGEECLVTLYVDKSSRLCATMKVYHYLSQSSPYKKDDRVEGVVYEISDNFGAFVAVDNQYSGLIAKKELFGNVKVGDIISARVVSVKEDGKLDLSIREKALTQILIDAGKVLDVIESFDGALPFNDKANPEVIKREMQMSKNEFKKAVGHLLKSGKIEITEKSIRLK